MAVSQKDMDEAEHWLFMPLVTIVNFSLFQYLVAVYYRRRFEARVALLLGCAFVGFAVIIPQANPDDELVGHLNDISEGCSTLTFLTQITIIGRDIERKVRIRSLKLLTYVAELLIFASLLDIVLNVLDVADPNLNLSSTDWIDNALETVCLFYVFFFRFFYITISRGYKWTLANKKMEMLLYALFMTHELPFYLLQHMTGVSWDPVQAVWHRLTLLMCVTMTIKEKMSARRTKASKEAASTAAFSKGPQVPQISNDDEDASEQNAGFTKSPLGGLRAKLFGGKVFPRSSAIATTISRSGASFIVRSGLSSIRGRSTNQSGRTMAVVPGPRRG